RSQVHHTEVPDRASLSVGRGAVSDVLALRVPPLPHRLQAHSGQHAWLLYAHRRRECADQGRDLLPVDVHHGRSPRPSVLRRCRCCPSRFASRCSSSSPSASTRRTPAPPTSCASSRPPPI